MKTKIYLIIVFGFWGILIIGCDSPTEYSLDPKEYFPLKVGNKWYYNSDYSDTTTINLISEVNGKEDIDFNEYFRIIEQNLQSNFIDTIFFRFGGVGITNKIQNGFIYHRRILIKAEIK
jgi:hypothetical protein